jgi:CTP synthase (UTP-ammonia lyase)
MPALSSALQIALVGDHDPTVTAHRAIPEALRLAGAAIDIPVHAVWLHTSSLGPTPDVRLAPFDAIWLVPASPYSDTAAALAAVRHARERGRPFLGTCGGFQHALLEYAAAVWRLDQVSHAELDPAAPEPVIAPLSCALVEQAGSVRFAPGSRIAALYGAAAAREEYRCRHGLNPRYAARLETGALRATAWDDAGEVRAVELAAHPFFLATLFQSERRALTGEVPPIVRGFLEAAVACRLQPVPGFARPAVRKVSDSGNRVPM